MGHVELVALRAAAQVGRRNAVMLAAVALPMVRETFLGKGAHGEYSLADVPPACRLTDWGPRGHLAGAARPPTN